LHPRWRRNDDVSLTEGHPALALWQEHYRVALIRTTPKILAFLAKRRGPMIAKVYGPTSAGPAAGPAVAGRIELWYPRRRRP
jgi:hypothetical protein